MANCLTKDPTTNKGFEYLPPGKKFKKTQDPYKIVINVNTLGKKSKIKFNDSNINEIVLFLGTEEIDF